MVSERKTVFLGTDSGATTSKTGGIDQHGELISRQLRQSATDSERGTAAVVKGWVDGAEGFLKANQLDWNQVGGVGLAVPGPYLAYGVLGKTPNLPASFSGWNFLEDYRKALAGAAGREIPLVTGNDGLFGGVAEAFFLQKERSGSVLMLAPGSGLGGAYVDASGQLFEGDHRASAIIAHSPAAIAALGLPPLRCGCGRDWGCVEAYTSISGLTQLIEHCLPHFPDHPLTTSTASPRSQALSLRDRAQTGDPLALAIFDLQAKALGCAIAAAAMHFDPSHVVIGGGLMDEQATTPAFRERYLNQVRATAHRYLWVSPDQLTITPSALGELSQAIGAALVARHSSIE